MKNPHILVLLSLLSLSTFIASSTTTDLNDDVLGLIVFKSELHDPPILSSWTQDDNSPCNWKFIKCNSSTNSVYELSLIGLGLSGKLGKGLNKLTELKVLSLSHNNLTGQISSEIFEIPTLQILDLSYNKFSGNFPNSFSQTSLSLMRHLDISHNSLSGPLPDDIFKDFSTLEFLSLAENVFYGPLPSWLSKCGALTELNLSNNRFSGNPFGENGPIWSLTMLRSLDLSNNFLTGNVPEGIGLLKNLEELYFQGNQFSDSIPSDMGLCSNLYNVDVSNNLLTGEIPSSFGNLGLITSLNLSNNKLIGEFPWWISNMTSLQHLDMSSNTITGLIPKSIGDLKYLQTLDLSNNNLSGSIPTSMVHLTKLSALRLRGNFFNGTIPIGMFTLALKELDLSGNKLTGMIPQGSSRMLESLITLDLSRNDLIGDITPMGHYSSLEYLNLSWNSLHSSVPNEIGYLWNLSVLDLRGSGLYGMIPSELCGASSRLSILQLDSNLLTGPIPQDIGNCTSLHLLSLSHNNLNGSIPRSLSMLKSLEILRLESNEFSGEMPKELGTLQNLVAFNVSYNNLIGRVPTNGVFPTLHASSLQGNLGLCTPLVKEPCKLNVQKPLVLDPHKYPNIKHGKNHFTEKANHGQFFSISAIIAIAAIALILTGVIVVILLNAFTRKKLSFKDNALESIFSSSSRSDTPSIGRIVLFDSRTSGNLLITNIESLINKASEIGEGGFGTVYKACLGMEGRVVAIKKLMASNILQFPQDFDREVRFLGKVKHPNLVSFRGYYWTPEVQLLVSDYAINGNLQFRLHELPPNMVPLSWTTRFKILLGIAKGLAHLHHSCNPPIIHYNLKPSNILLDENYNPKISDFGLVKLLEKQGVLGNNFIGAPGYAAPEMVHRNARINEMCDVYGFGVLTLEIVTGKQSIEYGEDNLVILNDYVRVNLEEGNTIKCVDESMGNYPDEEVLPVLKLALVCTSQIPSSRPSMLEVVQILQVIKAPVSQRLESF